MLDKKDKPKKEKQKKEKPLTPQDLLKYEIASELGLMPKVTETGWKSLTSRESGQIGGILAKRQRLLRAKLAEENAEQKGE